MAKYYDWAKTLSYQTGTNGEICIVIGARSIGKTYGLRKQCINDFIKHGKRFVEIVRNKSSLKGDTSITSGYFDKLQENSEFKGYIFKIESAKAYIARMPIEDEQPDWQLLAYFVALSDFQNLKRATFANVGRIIFDEAIIDKKDKYHHYLPNEYIVFAEMLNTIMREDLEKQTNIKTYLLCNACDLLCPYLQALEVNSPPRFGYNWYRNKSVLIHYVEPIDAQKRIANTVVGRLLDGYKESSTMFNNEFANADSSFIDQKTSAAKFKHGIHINNVLFGVWVDYSSLRIYINRQVPSNGHIFAITSKDNKLDYIVARKSEPELQTIINAYYQSLIYYDSPATRELFMNFLALFGVRV